MATNLYDRDYGDDIKLNDKYTLWCHDIYNKDWSKKSYLNLCEISNVSDFWRLFNNFHKLGMNFNHYYFMKKNIFPIWEDEKNRKGGICSIQIKINDSFELWERMNILMIFGEYGININGLSFSPKRGDLVLIKVWVEDDENIENLIRNKLNLSDDISVMYKTNVPEY